MTEKELTDWEHRSDVIKVLTSYEMGAWLHRRNKRLLQEIRDEIDQKQYDFMDDKDYDEGIRFGLMLAYQIIDKYRGDVE